MTTRIESPEARRRFAKWRMCTGKRKHGSLRDAEINLERLRFKRGECETLHAYRCPFCNFWHLGNSRGGD